MALGTNYSRGIRRAELANLYAARLYKLGYDADGVVQKLLEAQRLTNAQFEDIVKNTK